MSILQILVVAHVSRIRSSQQSLPESWVSYSLFLGPLSHVKEWQPYETCLPPMQEWRSEQLGGLRFRELSTVLELELLSSQDSFGPVADPAAG